MSDEDAFMLTDGGVPVGMATWSAIRARGDQLAFALAAVCDQPGQLTELNTAARAAVDVHEFEYVASVALGTLIQDIVRPLMLAVEGAGFPVRECLEAEAARVPASPCPVCGHRSHAVLELLGFRVQCLPTRRGEEPDGAP